MQTFRFTGSYSINTHNSLKHKAISRFYLQLILYASFCAPYVSLYISSFPQYSNWDDRWNFLLSMPQIVPKKKSILNFQTELKRLLVSNEPIPAEVRQQIIQTLNTIIGSGTLGEYSKSAFLQIASLLEQ